MPTRRASFAPIALVVLAAGASVALAQADAKPSSRSTTMADSLSPSASDTRAQFSLLHASGIVQPGTTTTIALHFTIDEGWHLYYNGQAEEGMQPQWDITVAPGWKVAGEPLWPAPTRRAANELTVEHIYERALTLLIPIEVPADAQPGPAFVRASAKWIVCQDVCLSEVGEASLRLRVVTDAASGAPAEASALPPPPADSKEPRHIIARAAQAAAIPALNSPQAAKLGLRATIAPNTLSFHASGEVAGLAYFPALGSTPIETDAQEWSVDATTLTLDLDPAQPPATAASTKGDDPTKTQASPANARGILEVRVRKHGSIAREYYRIDLAAPASEPK
jgi:DsbC/DsbD-like thiol-disulfide interchange protein